MGWYTPVIPPSWEAKLRKIMVGGSPGEKVMRPPSQQKSWNWWHMPVKPSYTGSILKTIT
jgi:hypothetical protein